MKKIIILVLVAIVSLSSLAFAASINGSFKGFDIVKLTLNGTAAETQVPPVNFFGKTSIPVADAAKLLNVIVEWNPTTWTANLYNPSVSMLVCDSVEDDPAGNTMVKAPFGLVDKGSSYDFMVYVSLSRLKDIDVTYRTLLINPAGETIITNAEGSYSFTTLAKADMGMVFAETFTSAAFSEVGNYKVLLQIKHNGTFKTVGSTNIFAE